MKSDIGNYWALILETLCLCLGALVVCSCRGPMCEPTPFSEFPTNAGGPIVPRDKTPSSNLTTNDALKIATDLTKVHREQLENYSSPVVKFFPEHNCWTITFPSKRPYTFGQPDTYRYIVVRVDDKTGVATYDSFPPPKVIPSQTTAVTNALKNPELRGTPNSSAYQKAALGLLVGEANSAAKALELPEDLPIRERDIVQSFLLPFTGAQSWKAIGTVSTRDFTYSVSKSNQLCYVTGRHQEEDMQRWKVEYSWPISRIDRDAAYQLATQWLAAVSLDVQRLNADCHLHIDAATPQAAGHAKSFVPVYNIYWVTKGREGRGSAASVRLFLPTRTLMQLRVDDPKYNLRTPLAVTNSAAVKGS